MSPSSALAIQDRQPTRLILEGSYELSDSELGRGGFCVVRRGVEVATGKQVAIKSYIVAGTNEAAGICDKFAHEVEVFRALHLVDSETRLADGSTRLDRADSCTFTEGAWRALAHHPRNSCFVRLLAHSKNRVGEPSQEADGNFYSVMELGDYTLEHFIVSFHKKQIVLEETLVREIIRECVASLTWLHALGFVHLDVKPANFMYFRDRWKLIDMDGVQFSGRVLDVTAIHTPLYASPELARAIVISEPALVLQTMDMWSFGVTILDVLCGGPALQEIATPYQIQMLLDGGDELEFFRFLSDTSHPLRWTMDLSIPPSPALDCSDLRDFVSKLLVKEPADRMRSVDALTHPFLLQNTLAHRRMPGSDAERPSTGQSTPTPLRTDDQQDQAKVDLSRASTDQLRQDEKAQLQVPLGPQRQEDVHLQILTHQELEGPNVNKASNLGGEESALEGGGRKRCMFCFWRPRQKVQPT